MAVVIPADTRAHYWRSKHSGGCFYPNGSKVFVNRDDFLYNPSTWTGDSKTLAARIFVGFNVGSKPRWDIDDLMKIVKRIRVKQEKNASASFIAQKGIFQSSRTGEIVVEDGAQVIIIDMDGMSKSAFKKDMIELAEQIAKAMKQEEVVLELQQGGKSIGTMGIEP